MRREAGIYMKIIISARGSSDLFPLSRAYYPKELIHFGNRTSLLQKAMTRFGGMVQKKDIIAVTHEKFLYQVRAETESLRLEGMHVLAEPDSFGTAASVALAAAYCRQTQKSPDDELLFHIPAGLWIDDKIDFAALLAPYEEKARAGKILLFGTDQFPAVPAQSDWESGILRSGRIFLCTIAAAQQEMKQCFPEAVPVMHAGRDKAVRTMSAVPDVAQREFPNSRSDNVEKAAWPDVASDPVRNLEDALRLCGDSQESQVSGDVVTRSCRNTSIIGGRRLVAAAGLSDLMIMDMDDVLLVARKGYSQDVRDISDQLKAMRRREAFEEKTLYFEWGWYSDVYEEDGLCVFKYVVRPREQIALQVHYDLSQTWHVISGTGTAALNQEEIPMAEGKRVPVDRGVWYSVVNTGHEPLVFMAIQVKS